MPDEPSLQNTNTIFFFLEVDLLLSSGGFERLKSFALVGQQPGLAVGMQLRAGTLAVRGNAN